MYESASIPDLNPGSEGSGNETFHWPRQGYQIRIS